MCYSEILSSVQERISQAAESNDKNTLLKLESDLAKLPIHGYESNCEKIRTKYKNLSLSKQYHFDQLYILKLGYEDS